MNLSIVPRQIEKENTENPLSRLWPKKKKGWKKTHSSSNAAVPDPEKKVPLSVIT